LDGIHDLGGKQGHGPVAVDDGDAAFHHDWEAREWGISNCARTPGITIDWWRHCRELILPADYLARPYFDSWAQTDFATFIEAGWISFAEIANGRADPAIELPLEPAPAMDLEQVVAADRAAARRFDAAIEEPPAFAVGDTVRTLGHGHRGHTRLPQYARGHRGKINAYHGAHVFPDLSARGIEVHRHCYNVRFESAELWGGEAAGKDCVYLDLWQDYLLAADD